MTDSTPTTLSLGADLSGRKIGDFQLLRRVGQGAMAEVYLAEQQQLRRRVAVKVLKPEFAQDTNYIRRFEREAQAAAALVHANIVQIYEVGRQGDLHYIAQEYVEGANLRDWLIRHGPPDLPHALSIMCQTAAALAKAGEAGIVHRDIKPENILITRQGEVKVADFGLAHFTRENQQTHLTQAGITVGTPLYMSPEQVEGKPLDHRSDLYSFGVTCYHLLAGQPPFSGETALGVAVQHLRNEAKPLEAVRPDLPPPLCRLVHGLLAKAPQQRPGSARAVLRELRRLERECCGGAWPDELPPLEALGSPEQVDARLAATQELGRLMATQALRQQRKSRRRAMWIAAMAATVLLSLAVGVRVFERRPLLADALEPAPRVPVQSNVMRQWYLATQEGTPEAWRSVIEHFPDQRYYVDRAKQQLALACLQEKSLDEARRLFEELADSGQTQRELSAFGFAGCYLVAVQQGRTAEAEAALARLWPLRQSLQHAAMKRLLSAELRRGAEAMGAEGVKWKRWLDEQTPPNG